eukprot:scaffold1175_cov140-Skeletonema_dohrnii-CCMP3373.AAC.3
MIGKGWSIGRWCPDQPLVRLLGGHHQYPDDKGGRKVNESQRKEIIKKVFNFIDLTSQRGRQ